MDQFVTVAFGLIVLAVSAIADLIGGHPTLFTVIVVAFALGYTVHEEKETLLRELREELRDLRSEIEGHIDQKIRDVERTIYNNQP
jgi:hypothetical protein